MKKHQNISARAFALRITPHLALLSISALLVATAPITRGADVISNGPVSTLTGKDAIKPRPGTEGNGDQFNYLFYILPGEGEADMNCATNPPPCGPSEQQYPHQPYAIHDSYQSTTQPVQSNDWWVGTGLQWYVPQTNAGWVQGFNPENNKPRTHEFISEPFAYDFVDFPDAPHGFRLWNQNAIAVKTNGKIDPSQQFNAAFNIIDRGFLQPENQAVVTVGLENVHPLSPYLGASQPLNPPWTNVRVRRYSDWGVVLAYANNGSEMEITMANGSPFTWLERTQGQANFLVWTGGPAANTQPPHIWKNDSVGQLAVLGVTVETVYGADNNIGKITSKAAYLVIADQGTWVPEPSPPPQQSNFRNATATKVVVLAMPHDRLDDASLQRAATELLPFACRKIVDTRIDYPPIPQSTPSVIVGNETVTLGYNPTAQRVALQLRLVTEPFLPGNCMANEPVQLLFPHHVKSLHPGQRPQLDARFTWHSIKGPLKLYRGSSFVQLIDTKGFLPFFPDQVVDSDLQNPLQARQLAVEDIYETMRNWFYLEEFQTPPGHISSFVRNIGTYDNQQVNTYEPNWATLIESLMIADQLAHSTKLRGDDTSTNPRTHACLCKPKTQVAAEMRDYILQTLKELVGQWADVYTAQFVQYNTDFKTTYGFPAGFTSVQGLSDHHFHFGYFLRAAAAIGRYDPAWLNAYLPFFDQLRKDVANYNRNDTAYPFLRNFSPFYGHNWADGTGQDGTNQESTSEAMNFSAALIDLGLLLGNNEWRDMGMYMYEQEIQAAEQYWFNQDATLSNVAPRPPVDPNDIHYNGNWPQEFVTFQGPQEGGGGVWHTTLGGRLHQRFLDRATFFGGIAGTYFIQMIPMSASTLYLGRNQAWLNATWKQYLLDTDAKSNPSFQSPTETFVAAWQALMPATGQGINGTGLTAALTRIAREHAFQAYGTNTMAKYWAYTNSLLGQVDTSVVADIPAYGVFKNGSGRTFVAYNPTDQETVVHFSGDVSKSLSVPAHSIVSESPDRREISFKPSQITTPAGRLYLLPTTSPTPLPMTGQLSSTPGTWLPTNETYPFPRESTDISRIKPSLAIVPKSTGQCSNLDLPGNPSGPNGGDPVCRQSNKAYAEWTGTFKGTRVGERPFTQMTIYTNPALHVGWQQAERGQIQSNTNVRIEYYFTNPPHPNPDRVEVCGGRRTPGTLL